MRQRNDVAASREESVQHGVATPGPSRLPPLAGDGEANVGGLRRHVEMREELGQVRIIQLVIDDEPGIDGDAGAVIVDIDRSRMTARPVVFLINNDLMWRTRRQGPGGGVSGDAGPDDSIRMRLMVLRKLAVSGVRCETQTVVQ